MFFVTEKPNLVLFGAKSDFALSVLALDFPNDHAVCYNGHTHIMHGTDEECEDFIYSIAGALGALNPEPKPPIDREQHKHNVLWGQWGEPDDKREELADYAHSAWAGWMEYLFSKCDVVMPWNKLKIKSESYVIPAESVMRWKRQMKTPYSKLPEREKASGRSEANEILGIMAGGE